MILQLYRVEHMGKVSYAVLREDMFFFVDLKNPNEPVSLERSAPVNACRILTPTVPSKIIGVGLNYRDHALERNKPIPAEPLLFLKPPSAILCPGDPIVLPEVSRRVDPEGELAVVLGSFASKLPSVEAAQNHVFGYTCFNDVTARDLQDHDVQYSRAKGFDTFAPFGPCVSIGVDPGDLGITTRVNGQVRQQSRTSQLIFSPLYLVWYVSQIMTLLPGDVISTGTPAGIAPVQAGDV
ncbi:MAG TPA: fumarylacetoacetate hydrolase family protein, partial [Acidobacteriota bacterium]|nr:fumarylacetoacetate hydrolase family protein [Acidobacteriota bacterium]